jgi:hypothetical protein
MYVEKKPYDVVRSSYYITRSISTYHPDVWRWNALCRNACIGILTTIQPTFSSVIIAIHMLDPPTDAKLVSQ